MKTLHASKKRKTTLDSACKILLKSVSLISLYFKKFKFVTDYIL